MTAKKAAAGKPSARERKAETKPRTATSRTLKKVRSLEELEAGLKSEEKQVRKKKPRIAADLPPAPAPPQPPRDEKPPRPSAPGKSTPAPGTRVKAATPAKGAAKASPRAIKAVKTAGRTRPLPPLPVEAKPALPKVKGPRKIFVLDTSVILYNHNAIHSFEDNDVVIPITVLEELDNFKKGNEIKNFEAREFIRIMDKLSRKSTLTDWVPLDHPGGGSVRVIMDEHLEQKASRIFVENKPDHRILNAALWLSQEHRDRKVILVTKDINLRLKAKSLDLKAEDFETGKIKNVEELYTGMTTVEGLERWVIDRMYEQGYCMPEDIGMEEAIPNHYYILKNGRTSALGFYNPLSMQVERLEKRAAYRITPRNAEQVFAMHAILNPEVKLVTMQGVAGTGKTLLALAGALEQRREYKQIYLARPIVPLSNKDIGYLPGDIKSKLNPYMEPLWDNLKFIQSQYGETEKEHKAISGMVETEKLLITPLAYIRGRSISNVIFIVDEAQNLTPHEVKTIITRAGENTKIIFTGDIYQIDTPYLDSQSNGLSYLIDKIKHHPIYAHVRLEKGERSELANLANELL
ncbi:MAG TPA: PhoH family protein [Bacteroidales bacterium]|nr:PhoH family protein [Bacteroidales bacterium]HRZ77366.1 PhoH family protein [Bacteroidales bacterium]